MIDHTHTTDSLSGECRHCEWTVIETSYARLVTAYQDHLRSEHPTAWLRS